GKKKRGRKRSINIEKGPKKGAKVPTIKIKLGKRKKETSEDDTSQDSDAEFEQMLAEAEDMNKAEDEAEVKKKEKKKPGFKARRKKHMRSKDEDGYETDHQ
ncbi:unnamed protein product, partial [Meganyctiphanes norvegica]